MKKKTSTSKKALNKKVAKGKKSPVKGGGGTIKATSGQTSNMDPNCGIQKVPEY